METNSKFEDFTDEEVIQYAVECIGQNGTVPVELEDRLAELGVLGQLEEVRPHVH